MLPVSKVALDELRVINGERIALNFASPGQLVKLREAMCRVIQEEQAWRDDHRNPRRAHWDWDQHNQCDRRIEEYRADIRAINGLLTSWRAYLKRQYVLPFMEN
jgi:hypothetical protein